MTKESENTEPNMIKEIREQGAVIKFLIDKYLGSDKSFAKLEFLKSRLLKVERAIFLGSGSSSHAAMLGNYMFEEMLSLPSEMELSDEFISREKVIEKNTVIIALSQSGETSDLLEAVKQAKKKKALIIAITNNPGSSLCALADHTFLTEAGKELSMAATKTFSTQILCLLIFNIVFLWSLEKRIPNKLIKELNLIPKKIDDILQQEQKIRNISSRIKDKEHLIVLGRKYNYPIALEGALKIKETCMMHAEGMAAEEFRHGPKAILKSGYVVVVLSPVDSVFSESKRLISNLKKEKSEIITISNKELKDVIDLSDELVCIPSTLEILNPILLVIPLQVLAFYLAEAKGIDTNDPKNLQKFIIND